MSDLSDRILAEACDLYLSDGLDGFSMRKLARQVGVTAPALYRHYDGKEAVLADVLRAAYRVFTRHLYDALEAPTPLERFLAAADGYLDFVFEQPRWYVILNTAPEALGMQAFPADVEAMGCAVHQFWIDRVRECMDAGILKADDPASASLTMWAHTHGLIQLYHQGKLRMDETAFRALFRASSGRLMAGVATEEYACVVAVGPDDATTAEMGVRNEP